MTDNETISKARGEKYYGAKEMEKDLANFVTPNDHSPDYSGSALAWTPELYQRIEDVGLMLSFVLNLRDVVSVGDKNVYICPDTTVFNEAEAWFLLKATPEQKARALAMAIKEAE